MLSKLSAATVGPILAVVVLAVAAYFAVRQEIDRRRREADLSEADALHFARQDVRRFLGSVVMLLIAAGMVAGTLFDPRASRAAGRLFLAIWAGMGVLLCLLFWLAVHDWLSIRAYARRHRRALAEERAAALAEQQRRQAVRRASEEGWEDVNGPVDDDRPR
ncbi:MAG: hypothetical protein IRY99_07810 [Isosphaeraceae bacterium]|nr:hypothetical protein [Isosphaeraceae bacterium]